MIEQLQWFPAALPPDDDVTVLICRDGEPDEPVWLGYKDGDTWRHVEGFAVDGSFPVTAWAEMPGGPRA